MGGIHSFSWVNHSFAHKNEQIAWKTDEQISNPGSPLKGFLRIVSLKATTDKWRFRFWFRGVQFISGVWTRNCTPRISSLGCVAHRGNHLCGGLHTEEIIFAVGCTPRRSSPRYAAHRRDRWDDLHGMLHMHTAKFFSKFRALDSAVCCTPLRLSPPQYVAHRGVLHIAEVFVIEYLNKIETVFENTLACLSGAQMGSNHEINWRSKISWQTPFKRMMMLEDKFWLGYTSFCFTWLGDRD